MTAIETRTIVTPGEVVSLAPTSSSSNKIRLGAGLCQERLVARSVKAGTLAVDHKGRHWVDNKQKRYIPSVDDNVLGVVTETHSMEYKITLGCPRDAILPVLAFEGATKRNRPNYEIGDLVYCRVAVANKDMEPELTCISPHFKKEWMTGEALYTRLEGGYTFECSLEFCRKLLSEDNFVLTCLGKHVPFEISIGVNGRVWVKCATVLDTILVTNCILNSEHMKSREQIEAMVGMLLQRTR